MGSAASLADVANQYTENNISKEELVNTLLPYYLQNTQKFDEVYRILQTKAEYEMQKSYQSEQPCHVVEESYSMTNEIVEALNLARSTPKHFIPLLEDHLATFIDDLHYIGNNDSNVRVRTREGKAAVLECIAYLQSVKPVCEISGNSLLESSALDHVKELARYDKLSHVSMDGTSIQQRIERYGTWRGYIGENIDCGNRNAVEIIMMLLIDDGDSSRGHRESCFNPNFLEVGAALASHPSYQCCCVMDFATQIIPWCDVQTTPIIVESNSKHTIQEQSEDFQKVVRSIPMDDVIQQIYDMLEIVDSQITIDYQPEQCLAIIQCKTGKSIRKLNVTWESK